MMNTITQLSPYQTQWTVMPASRPSSSSNSTWLRTPVGFLETTRHIPVLTAALGEDPAGAPVLIDFTSARSFPVQIHACAEYRQSLIETLINSACTVNLPEEFQFVIISAHPEDYETVCDSGFVSGHCRGNASSPSEGLDWLLEFAAQAHQHTGSKFTGPYTLVVVDDFSSFINSNPETKIAWQWLIRHGINAGILLAVLNDPSLVQANFTNSQSLHFLDIEAVHFLLEIGIEPAIESLQAQIGHFFVQSNGKWLTFNVPALSAA